MRHRPHELLSRIAAGKDSCLELKELSFSGKVLREPETNALADEIAAFSNARGGQLVLGIADNTNEILGILFENLDSVGNLVREICLNALDPPVDAMIEELELPGSSGNLQWVLLVELNRSLSVHGSPGGHFLHSGTSKRRLLQDQLGRLMQQRSRTRLIQFDETAVPGTWLSHLDPVLVDRFRTSRTSDELGILAVKLGMATNGKRSSGPG